MIACRLQGGVEDEVRMEIVQILAALDAASTTGVAATLTGLSLTASSFVVNLAKTKTDDRKQATDNASDYAARHEKAKEEEDKFDLARLRDREKVRAVSLKAEANSANAMLKRLILAFVFFSLNLIESLSLDPLIEKSDDALRSTLLGLNELQLHMIDVCLSDGFLAMGVFALWLSAKDMRALIAKD